MGLHVISLHEWKEDEAVMIMIKSKQARITVLFWKIGNLGQCWETGATLSPEKTETTFYINGLRNKRYQSNLRVQGRI